MMSKNILLLAAVLASICQPGKRFPNMDKWILADTAKPEKWREVTDEYQYDENGVQAKSTDVKREQIYRNCIKGAGEIAATDRFQHGAMVLRSDGGFDGDSLLTRHICTLMATR